MTVRSGTSRGLAVAVVAASAMAPVSLLLAGNASAYGCYEAACVPNVVIGATDGAPCAPQPGRAFAYGLKPDGGTVVCNSAGVWVAAAPLIGVYNVAQRCPALNLSAQGADGIALQCGDQGGGDLRWVHRVDIPG